ncbi:MAG: hypothetical protein RSF86_14880, partial [Angelakisella sp.]
RKQPSMNCAAGAILQISAITQRCVILWSWKGGGNLEVQKKRQTMEAEKLHIITALMELIAAVILLISQLLDR